jgi:hypothetical protein
MAGAETPKRRRSILDPLDNPMKGPDTVSVDKVRVKFVKKETELKPDSTGAIDWTKEQRAADKRKKQEARDREAQIVRDEIAADEAMRARRL